MTLKVATRISGLVYAVLLACVAGIAEDSQPLELNTVLMHATVRLSGMTPDGPKFGTGFIMGRPVPTNPKQAQFVLITANHVPDDVKSHFVIMMTRKRTAAGAWERVEVPLQIRALVSNFRVNDAFRSEVLRGATFAVIYGATRYDLKPVSDSLMSVRDSIRSLNIGLQADVTQEVGGFQLQIAVPNVGTVVPVQLVRFPKSGAPETLLIEKQLWTKHPQADVSAMYIRVPNGVFDSILPTTLLADDGGLKEYGLHPGDELNCLGYPLGAESNLSGFPILRSGKIASYPLLPSKETVSFLMDFQVFGGNSGGPVYIAQSGGTRMIAGVTRINVSFQVVVGLVSEEVVLKEQQRSLYERSEREYPLKLAKVIHASFIRETLEMLPPPFEDAKQ